MKYKFKPLTIPELIASIDMYTKILSEYPDSHPDHIKIMQQIACMESSLQYMQTEQLAQVANKSTKSTK